MNRLSHYILAAAALLGLAACSDNVPLVDASHSTGTSKAIEFGYSFPVNGTRTTLSAKTGFPIGSAMAVDGFQTDEYGNLYTLFKDDKVTKIDDVNWTYDNARYWDIASTYVFYAMFPYEVSHTFDANRMYAIKNFVVADKKDDQLDVMISEEKKAMPENLVTFNLNHLLSQVNFYLKAHSDLNTNGIAGIDLISFDVTGVRNTGSYQQTGYNSQNLNVVGQWTVNPQGEYDMPAITSADRVTPQHPVSTIEDGLLMLPQPLTSAFVKITYRLLYNNGTSSAFTADVNLAAAMGKLKTAAADEEAQYIKEWTPNHVYNYFFAVNPSKRTLSDYTIDDDGSDNDGDGVVNPDHTLVVDDEGNWGVDTDGDGKIDIPIVWEDIDGDGKEEGGLDRDGDGHIDNVDGENENPDGNPLVTDGDPHNPDGKDAIIVDTDGDGVGDTQLERETTIGPNGKPLDEYTTVDWDGSKGGDGTTDQKAEIVLDADGNPTGIKVDTDGDGVTDTTYPVAWEDVDGDGKLELGVDRDGDGKIDNVDGEDLNLADPNSPSYDKVSDANANNPEGKDVILVDTDGDGIADAQIEKGTTYSPDPVRSMEIKFSATIEDFENATDADVLTPGN